MLYIYFQGAEATILTNRQFVIGMAILLVMTPLCLLKKISKLGMVLIIYLKLFQLINLIHDIKYLKILPFRRHRSFP